MDVAITGSHGLIGTALGALLQRDGHRVLRLVRDATSSGDVARWDPEHGTIDREALEGIDAVVHLAGVGIGDKKWTPARKRQILESRTRGTTLLAEALAGLSHRPRVLVSASAVGYYGSRGEELLTEESRPGDDFVAGVVVQWEAATEAAAAAGIRVVRTRSGIVLARHGGALARMLLPFRLGLGGRVASGRQYMSWIAIDDEVGAIVHALTAETLTGPVNLTAPSPVRNAEFAKTLGKVLHRPTVLPTPLLPLKLVYSEELVRHLLVEGQRVVPAKLEASGYAFAHPELEGALRSVLGKSEPRE